MACRVRIQREFRGRISPVSCPVSEKCLAGDVPVTRRTEVDDLLPYCDMVVEAELRETEEIYNFHTSVDGICKNKSRLRAVARE